jgi:hypothetical protein
MYLIGSFGLRVIGLPTVLKTLFRPNRESPLRFVLALFVVLGVVIALTCRIVPAASLNAYNNSAWFFAQSKYVAWIFAVEVLQGLYRIGSRNMPPLVAALAVTTAATALTIPATIQHFALEANPQRIYGKSVQPTVQSYSKQTLDVMAHLKTTAQPGDVVLPEDDLLGPVLALTKCRVPMGYFSNFLVSNAEYVEREKAQKEFWKAWGLGQVRSELLLEAKVRYIVCHKRTEDGPSILSGLLEIFSNSEFSLFEVEQDGSKISR